MAHRKNKDGLEAPRNSLESSMDVSQSFQLVHENAPYCCQVKKYSSKTYIYHNGATIKMLLDEELSSRTNTRLTATNIIARLMGMDTLPSEVKPIVCPKEVQNEDSRKYKLSEINAANACFLNSKPIKQTKQELLRYNNYGIRDSSRSTKNQRLAKPQRREHPEEETLQKFKKEFEAWQTFKVLEHSRALQRKRKGKDKQSFAEENLDNQEVGKCTDTSRISAYKGPSKPKKYVSPNKLKTDMQKYDNLQDKGYMGKQWCNLRDSTSSRNRLKTNDVEQIVNAQFHKKKHVTPSSTRIVILKPSSEMIDNIEEPWTDSSEILEKDGSMKDFLEEVKERLKFEMQRKVKNNYMTKGSSSQTSLSGRPADPKQLAQDIAKHIRESVSKDIGMTLNQSESIRTYRSEIPPNGNYSTEVIKRDTGKLIAQTLKDVLESETDLERPVIDNTRLGASLLMKNKVRSKSLSDFPKMGKYLSHWDDKKALSESIHRSSRRKQERSTKCDAERILPRNLVRSFSAPVPRTAFGKLLPEDHGIVSRKHGLSDNILVKSRKHRKNSFNLKGRVSNLRWKLTLKAILFGKKIQSVDKPAADIFDSMEAIVTASPAVMSSGAAQDNSTEVPPSPASVSSSSHDEFCKPGHPSPVSPLEVPIFEDHTSCQVSEELIVNLPGMRLGNLYCDPLMTPGGPKITARQRWTPTPVQLQILENIFDQGNGTPSKQKIKEITLELAQHGQISETNVYNWFQNRRARSKRKQTSALPYNNTESEAEAENESPDEKKSKSDQKNCNEKSEVQNMNSAEPKRTHGMLLSNDCSKSSSSLGQMSYYESVLSHQRIDHLIGKIEFPADFHPFKAGENYDMVE